jgi:hypothetical protein
MFEKKNLLRAAIAAALTSGLVACGGGSSGSDGTPPSSQQGSETGRLVDSSVAGIEYVTSSGFSGITGTDGEFYYNPNETIDFKLGNLYFGKADSRELSEGLVTPETLAGDADNDGSRKAKIARVLQTLDSDGDPENGITIDEKTRTAASGVNIPDVADADLESETVKKTITGLAKAAENENYQPQDLKSEEEAVAHLEDTLGYEIKVTSCGENTDNITEADLANKTFGIVDVEGGDRQIRIMQLDDQGKITEWADDNGELQSPETGKIGSWSVDSASNFKVVEGDSTTDGAFTACKTPTHIIVEDGEQPGKDDSLIYELKPFNTPTGERSYLLSGADFTSSEIISIDSELNVTYDTENGSTQASIVNDGLKAGALEITDTDGSVDYLYLLKAQGTSRGIYVDYGTGTATTAAQLEDVVVATMVNPVTNATFSGKTFIERDVDSNTTIILVYKENGTVYDYHNDSFVGSEQTAGRYVDTWSVDSGLLIHSDEPEGFQVIEAENALFSQDGGELIVTYKTQAIDADSFVGTFNVNVPTENTVDNELVISSDGSCSYGEATTCNWSLNNGKAEIGFGSGETASAQIWQIAGTDTYGFLITHSDNADDIEVGFMTRK